MIRILPMLLGFKKKPGLFELTPIYFVIWYEIGMHFLTFINVVSL
jgi:hypothetical protein